MRRVVVTGLGMVSPLASGVEATWRRLLNGESGATPIEKFDVSQFACKIAAQVPRIDRPGGERVGDDQFIPDDYVEPKEQRRMDDFIVYALAAAQQAMDDSGLELKTEEEFERAGVLCGSGIGGLEGIEKYSLILEDKGPRRVSPFFITGSLINLISGQISIRSSIPSASESGQPLKATTPGISGQSSSKSSILSPSLSFTLGLILVSSTFPK